jgi:hypothetical protein
MKLLSDKELNTIRGKASVGKATPAELRRVFEHLDAIEAKLDELDFDDYFGSEGWRHAFDLPDAD